MLRYLPAALEVLGLFAATFGAFLFNPALGLVAAGSVIALIGYALEEAK